MKSLTPTSPAVVNSTAAQKHGPAQPVKYHILTGYGRDGAATAVAVRPVAHPPCHQSYRSPSIRYPIPFEEASNAVVTPPWFLRDLEPPALTQCGSRAANDHQHQMRQHPGPTTYLIRNSSVELPVVKTEYGSFGHFMTLGYFLSIVSKSTKVPLNYEQDFRRKPHCMDLFTTLSRGKRAREPPEYRRSPPYADTRDSAGVTSASPAS
ncbi:hypothetical protein EVAR_29664_1 [Eumeta japonica]|uniref:Uncharacterized protein n=1 Tax=Eumeta variegata TaxID=151549 RepID=A0A4C1W7L3_EUMVA|nr:hypothetical protein EVAR_29664_1 [Eumeta japonica]